MLNYSFLLIFSGYCEVKYVGVLQVYTISMFAVSIFLWIFLPWIPLISGTPGYLADPLFTLELFSMVSTGIVWVMTGLISLHSLRKLRMPITRSITENLFVISLVFVTIVVTILGSMFFSRTVPDYLISSNRHLTLYALDGHDPLFVLYFFGTLFCEGAWIIQELPKLKPLVKSIKHLSHL